MKNHLITFISFLLLILFCYNCKKEEIVKKEPIVVWEMPYDIYDGQLLSEAQLNATVNIKGILVYNPSFGTKLNVGNHQTLELIFTPLDNKNYDTVRKVIYINVLPKINPEIIWSNPADIGYGTLLSKFQLNASCNVEGNLNLSCEVGTKLNPGLNQELKATFTPNDTIAYNKVTKSVFINVIPSEEVYDADGNLYHTIVFGTQTWMIENLKTTKYNNGTLIANVTDNTNWFNTTTPAYCWYNNNISNKDKYGALYNTYTLTYANVCPTGWHVPSDGEWTIFENYLIANGYNYDNSLEGNKIAKALASDTGWMYSIIAGSPGNKYDPPKRNATGFSALPGGYRVDKGDFYMIEGNGYWYYLNSNSQVRSLVRYLGPDYVDMRKHMGARNYGYSVRCIKD